jgi:hypothetical protein
MVCSWALLCLSQAHISLACRWDCAGQQLLLDGRQLLLAAEAEAEAVLPCCSIKAAQLLLKGAGIVVASAGALASRRSW